MTNVEMDGVLYVWLAREFSSATDKSSEVGHQRFVAVIELIRSTARGEHSAIHVPPSEPKPFLWREVIHIYFACRPRDSTGS
jgi:hypothetical protein